MAHVLNEIAIPSTAYTRTTTPRIREVKFGGGYSQRVPDAFNSLDVSWNVTFQNREFSKAKQILDLFEEHRGTEGFYFTPPDETTQHLVICKEWSYVVTSPFTKTITCKFEKIYE